MDYRYELADNARRRHGRTTNNKRRGAMGEKETLNGRNTK